MGGAQYEIGSVPAATCQVTDTEDGNSTFAATLSAISGPNAAYGVGNQTASCSYTDAGSLLASAEATYEIVDTTLPVIIFANRTAMNGNGWNNTDVTVNWTCTDSGSGVVAATVSTTISIEGANQSATGICTDHVGNTASNTQAGINIDKTAPLASASASPAANGNGWNNSNVTVSFSGTDVGGSGIASCDAAVVLSSEGAGQSASGACTDLAGNVSATATASGINIDKTAPLLHISGAASGAYNVCTIPTRPTFGPTDNLSGLIGTPVDSWTTPTLPTIVGTYTYSASATDVAGNTSTETRTYVVTYGSTAFSGYLQPINTDGSSRFKLGSTIPVKFKLTCNGVPITNAVAKLYVAKGDSVPDPGVDEAISTSAATTGNLFRYDSTAQQYIFNLSTKIGYTNPSGPSISAFSVGTWTLKLGLDDGTFQSINIQLPK